MSLYPLYKTSSRLVWKSTLWPKRTRYFDHTSFFGTVAKDLMPSWLIQCAVLMIAEAAATTTTNYNDRSTFTTTTTTTTTIHILTLQLL